MANESQKVAELRLHSKETKYFSLIVGLHLLVLVANSASLYLYFSALWQQEHYRFFPIAMLVFVYMLFVRIQHGKIRESIWISIFCTLMLLFSVLLILTSVLIVGGVLLPTISSFLVVGSLLACLQDKESGRSLLPLWWILVPLIRIPLGYDMVLITQLQYVSSGFASSVLDFLHVSNYAPGTMIEVASQSTDSSGVKLFEVERACSGVQSMYTLFFCTLTIAVWTRRSFVMGLTLVLSGVFWSMTVNGIRIVICVSFYVWFDYDVYSGISHEILGYLMLFTAIGLIASTDAIVAFVFGSVDASSSGANSLSVLWNRFVAGQKNTSRRRVLGAKWPKKTQLFCRTAIVASLVISCFAMITFSFSSRIQDVVSETKDVSEVTFVSTDLPREFMGELGDTNSVFSFIEFKKTVRGFNSIKGNFSDTWYFTADDSKNKILVSIDYPFIGWHPLQACYRSGGWEVEQEVAQEVIEDPDWGVVELEMRDQSGRFGFCIYSPFDFEGIGMNQNDASTRGVVDNFFGRLRKFSRKTNFQVQCFIESSQPFSNDELDLIRKLHRQTRNLLRSKVLEKLEMENASVSSE